MRTIIFTIAISLPMLASGQTAYTNCQSYGNRIDCKHTQQQPAMGRIQTVNPGTYMPQAAPLPSRNPIVDGINQAQEQQLRQEQLDYYRNLNRQMR